jgi:hypothetical protein
MYKKHPATGQYPLPGSRMIQKRPKYTSQYRKRSSTTDPALFGEKEQGHGSWGLGRMAKAHRTASAQDTGQALSELQLRRLLRFHPAQRAPVHCTRP